MYSDPTTSDRSNVVATAVANRTARIAWAVLSTRKPYRIEDAELSEGGACYPQPYQALHKMGGSELDKTMDNTRAF